MLRQDGTYVLVIAAIDRGHRFWTGRSRGNVGRLSQTRYPDDMLVEVAAVVPFVCTPMGVSQVGFTGRFGLCHVNGKLFVLCVG